MHDIHQALDVLRELTDQPDLAFGAGEHVEVVFDGVPVGFIAVDRHHFELVTPLRAFASPLDSATLTHLMTANHLGAATGAARLAYDPGRQQVVLGERLDLRALDANGLRTRLVAFLTAATFWNGPGGRELAAGPPPAASAPMPQDQFLIRG